MGCVLVAVKVVFERAAYRHADVLCLLWRKLCQLRPDLCQMQRRDLLIELLGQSIDLPFVFPRWGGEQLDLRQDLVAE